MKTLRTNRQNNHGIAMIIIMIVLVVATAIGIWGLSNSKTNMLKAGSKRFTADLKYQSEQGLQIAIRRIQAITATPPIDQVATVNRNDTTAGKSGGVYTDKNINTLLIGTGGTAMCADGSCAGTVNAACTNFSYLKKFDVVDQNVVCNFLGVMMKTAQVSVVRKADLVPDATHTFAIYLVNSIATDTSGRKQGIQAVVVVPYSGAGPYTSTGIPYMASSKAITD